MRLKAGVWNIICKYVFHESMGKSRDVRSLGCTWIGVSSSNLARKAALDTGVTWLQFSDIGVEGNAPLINRSKVNLDQPSQRLRSTCQVIAESHHLVDRPVSDADGPLIPNEGAVFGV